MGASGRVGDTLPAGSGRLCSIFAGYPAHDGSGLEGVGYDFRRRAPTLFGHGGV
ncbi:hypothetical protein D1872_302430 [compost metagenome]